MQRKLKAIFRRSRSQKVIPQSKENTSYYDEGIPPHVDPRFYSPEQRGRSRSNSSKRGSQYIGRDRPLTSAYDSRHKSDDYATQPPAVDYAQPLTPLNGAIAEDYKAYLPVLSSGDESYTDAQHMTLGGDRRLIIGEGDARHEEDVADRNIDRYSTPHDVGKKKPSMTPSPMEVNQEVPRKHRASISSSTISPVPSSVSASKYALGTDTATRGGLIDSIRPRTEGSAYEKNHWKKTGLPLRTARDEGRLGWSKRRPQGSDSDDEAPRPPPNPVKVNQEVPVESEGGVLKVATAGLDGRQENEAHKQLRLDGIMDLRDTVETHQDTEWAPAVTHEIIKPHEHEVVQHKLYREIHNYEYYHRLQPVIHTEVLPPRHWIPNPNGDGLIEISADELPARTGTNRWWDIVQKQFPPLSTQDPSRKWRTEPEVIEGPTYTTKEGFERKETTIIYPPTLADLSSYKGLIQPVHFDHQTGERWLGEVTTMAKLKEQADAALEADKLTVKELVDSLPQVPQTPDSPDPSLRRKPVNPSFPMSTGQVLEVR